MKKIKTILIIFTLIMFCQIEPLYVNAQTFLTDSNIELTEEEYNYLLQFYPESIIAKMDEEKLNYELSHDFKLLGNETKYITTHTHYVGNIPTEVIEENIQEKEYNNLVTPYTACNFGNDCWETTSKKVSLSVYTPSSNVYRIYMSNEWKNIPSVKSFDVLATAVDGINFTQ